ncbi:hypothetical protein FH972_001968 [Carpinus fangiana]|uniref:acetyl-CoA carboxytransferase n=1 Tax=Carpinus fangiana TaxID=176857 RepID=A0A5N6QGK6_9ROSI|nr:hypothetical protein FH972_001968 [Carpinus fangiana]
MGWVLLRTMFGLKVPVVSIVIGEGGSGGALAIGCANKLLMLENAVFYVASSLSFLLWIYVLPDLVYVKWFYLIPICADVLLALAVFLTSFSPEACAAILWKTAKAALKAAERLKITAPELCKLQIADGIIPAYLTRHIYSSMGQKRAS